MFSTSLFCNRRATSGRVARPNRSTSRTSAPPPNLSWNEVVGSLRMLRGYSTQNSKNDKWQPCFWFNTSNVSKKQCLRLAGSSLFFRIHRSLGIGFCMLLLLSVCRLMISDCKCTTVFGTDIWCGQTSDHVLEVAMVFDSWITAIHSCWLLDTLVCRTGLPKPNHPIPLWGYPSFLIKCRFVSPANKTSLIARKAGKEGPKILVQNPHVACRIDWTGLKILNHHGMSHFVYFVNVLQLHFSFCFHKCETSFPVLLCTSPSSASKISINAWTGTTLAGGRFGWSISTQAADVLLCTCESLNLKRRSSTHRNSQNVV